MESATHDAMLAIVCDLYAVDDVIDHLRSLQITHFTVVRGVLGSGDTGRREGSPVWPGENAVLFCCLPQYQVRDVVADLARVHDARGQHTVPLKVFCLPAQELL